MKAILAVGLAGGWRQHRGAQRNLAVKVSDGENAFPGRSITGLVQELIDRRDEPGGAIRGNQAPVKPVPQRVARPVAVAPNHRQAACKSLQENNAEALAGAGHHKDVGSAIQVWQVDVGHVAREPRLAGHTEAVCELLQALPIVAVSRNNIDQVWMALTQRDKCVQYQIVSFVTFGRGEPRNGQEHFLAV